LALSNNTGWLPVGCISIGSNRAPEQGSRGSAISKLGRASVIAWRGYYEGV
jgi:hypothetical protein